MELLNESNGIVERNQWIRRTKPMESSAETVEIGHEEK
jgi:hypothetical protein